MAKSAARRQGARSFRGARIAGWLALAASPAFAAMAWLSATDPGPMALCSADGLPLRGMPAMYVLMSVFHLPSWLRLGERAGRPAAIEGERE